MSATVIAGIGAFVLYMYARRKQPKEDRVYIETHRNIYRAPKNWYEALFLVSEALRCVDVALQLWQHIGFC